MLHSNLSQLLSNLGWGSGFRLPVANDENKALESLLEQKQKYLLEINATLEADTQHCKILKTHFERVSHAVNQSQKMITAKRGGVETEHNLKNLSERVHSRLKHDYGQTTEEIQEYQQRNRRLSDDIAARKRIVDDLIGIVKFDQEALDKYKEVSTDKENYIKYMNTLTQLDERVSQDFQLKFGKIGEELSSSRRILNESAMYTQTLQQQFGRLCTQFRRVHNERSQAINFWENTLRSMKQRDEDIKSVAEDYTDIREKLQAVESQCDRNRTMLESERNNAQSLEYQVTSSDKNCGDHRLKIGQTKEYLMTIKDELLTCNTIISQTSRIVKEVTAKINQHENELAKMQQRMEKAGKELMEAKSRHDAAIIDTTSAEERTRDIEKMIDEEEQRTEAIIHELEKQRRHMWQRSNDCHVLESKLKGTVNRIKGTKTMIISLRDRAKGDDLRVQKKRQQAYQLELEFLSLESRSHQLVAVVPPQSSNHKEDVSGLKDKLQEIIKTKTFLVTQENYLNNMNARLKREIQNVLAEHANLKVFVDNEKMEAKRCVLDNKKAVVKVQNYLVENSLLKMTLKRCQNLTQQARDKMFSLEQERIMVEAAAKERRAEIDLHMNLLKAQQKNLKDERAKLASFILEVMNEIDKTKTRYDYIINAMSLSEDENKSESYYILKAAQERESLKREGDLWDAKVKEAEKEIAALQNTLSVLYSSNVAFRESLAPASADTPEAKMLSDMEQEQKLAIVRKRKADKRKAELSNTGVVRQSELTEVANAKMYLESVVGEKKYELNSIHFEIANQKAKIDRANKMSGRLIRELGLHIHEDKEAIELDLKLRCAREKFEFGLKTLEKTLFLHSELRGRALNFLVNTELELIIPRLRKRLAASENTSPYHSGQVTPIRYLTPMSSTTVLQPLHHPGHKEKLTEMCKGRSRQSHHGGQKSPISISSKELSSSARSKGSQSGRTSPRKKHRVKADSKDNAATSKDTTTLFVAKKLPESPSEIFVDDAGHTAAAEGVHEHVKKADPVSSHEDEEQKLSLLSDIGEQEQEIVDAKGTDEITEAAEEIIVSETVIEEKEQEDHHPDEEQKQ